MPLARNSHRVVAGSGTNPPGGEALCAFATYSLFILISCSPARGQSMSRDYSGQDSGPSEARLNAWTGPNGNHAGPLENWTTMDNNDYDRRLPPPPSPVITAHAASSGEDEAAFSSSWEVSATADSGPVLPNDLQALVVKDFNLSWASQSTCTGFATVRTSSSSTVVIVLTMFTNSFLKTLPACRKLLLRPCCIFWGQFFACRRTWLRSSSTFLVLTT